MNSHPETVVIVPYGHNANQPERQRLLYFVTKECLQKQSYKNIKLVLIERSTKPYQKAYAKSNYDNYIFIKSKSGPFSLGLLQNIAIAKLKSNQFFYIHLPDFLLPINSIENSLNLMKLTGAPCIFPFYGAVSLTKPITSEILSKKINWLVLANKISKITSNKSFKNKENLIKHPQNPNRIQLTNPQIKDIDSIMPKGFKSYELIKKCSDKDLWGDQSNNQFNFYGLFKSPGNDETIGSFRSGPRAKPSYLCNTKFFIRIGGTEVKQKGWNCEDLWFWERVKISDKNYTINNNGIFYKKTNLSGKYPFIHLWHNISTKLVYYKNAEKNINDFRKFEKLTVEEKLKSIKPIDIDCLKKCQEI
jgi:hypothetical protein